jgi:LmbE family N-acetylglucosaminyl deacetylase
MGALYQRGVDLKTEATVMVLAGEPGEEDLATMTELRMETGAHIVAVYLTNGGGTPSDDRDDIPYVAAGRRKEEAYRALSEIGCRTFFLNSPDEPIGRDPGGSAETWEQDSVGEKVAAAVDRFRPDMVLISRALRESDSARTLLLLRSCMDLSGLPRTPVNGQGGYETPWRIPRVFMEVDSAEGSVPVNANRIHPYWKRSYSSIALDAWREYASLRMTLQERSLRPVHWYRQVGPVPASRARSLLKGEPRLTAGLAWVKRAIMLGLDLAGRKQKKDCLTAIAEALARIENLMASKEGRLNPLEQRVLARWKDGLEDFRCSFDEVSADVQPGDSILAERQMFFLRIRSVHFPVPAEETEIIFPTAGNSSWVINESGRNRFPLKVPAEFRILTPEKLQWNYPASLYGLGSSEMRTTIPYFIVHRDKDRALNFAYRGEVSLMIGPGRALQVLTPVIRMTSGEEVRFALYSITRQPMKAEAWVKDSIIADSRVQVSLARKDDISVNRLPLAWQDTTGEGDHMAEIHIGRQAVGHFLVRSLDVRGDSTVVAGLVSGMPGGIMETSLRRLHVRSVILDSAALRAHMWDRCTVIIIDRNALALRPDINGAAAGLRTWVEAGGRVVMFPQHGMSGTPVQVFPEFGFGPDVTPPYDSVDIPDGALRGFPNPLTPSDWERWVVSRSTDRIVAGSRINTELIAGTNDLHRAVILRAPFGRGSVTAVSLDLGHQLETLHAGACRIFANLLSR